MTSNISKASCWDRLAKHQDVYSKSQTSVDQLQEEVEETLLCCLAAGVPASHIQLGDIEVVSEGYSFHMQVQWSFKPGYAF